jgi:hypothetical protein
MYGREHEKLIENETISEIKEINEDDDDDHS